MAVLPEFVWAPVLDCLAKVEVVGCGPPAGSGVSSRCQRCAALLGGAVQACRASLQAYRARAGPAVLVDAGGERVVQGPLPLRGARAYAERVCWAGGELRLGPGALQDACGFLEGFGPGFLARWVFTPEQVQAAARQQADVPFYAVETPVLKLAPEDGEAWESHVRANLVLGLRYGDRGFELRVYVAGVQPAEGEVRAWFGGPARGETTYVFPGEGCLRSAWLDSQALERAAADGLPLAVDALCCCAALGPGGAYRATVQGGGVRRPAPHEQASLRP